MSKADRFLDPQADRNAERYYSISEAAQKLGVSISTLRRWEREGKISIGRTLGGKRLFTSQDIELLSSPLKVQVIDQGKQTQDTVQISSTPVKQASSASSKASAPIVVQNYGPVFLALFGLLILVIATGTVLFQYARPDSKVLGVQDFIVPISQEISPLLSPVSRFFSNIGSSIRLAIGGILLSLLPQGTVQTQITGKTVVVSSEGIPDNLVLSSLDVTGNSTLSTATIGSLSVANNETIRGNLTVTGKTTLKDDLKIDKNITLTGVINSTRITDNKLLFGGDSPSIYAGTTNTGISLNANGTGAISIGNSSKGDIYLGGGDTAGTRCMITNASGNLTCSGDITLGGGDILSNSSTLRIGTSSNTVNIAGTLTVGTSTTTITGTTVSSGQLSLTREPTLVHTGTWVIGSSTWNESDATIYVNPASATADSNIFALSVGGSVKFDVDAEGDVYANNIITAGSVTSATTTVGTLSVEGGTTLGDATSDTLTINPATITLAGGNKTIDLTGAATRTLTLLNSTASQVADLDLSDGVLKTGGTQRLSNAGVLSNVTLSWTDLTDYPTGCSAGQAVSAVGDTLTCITAGLFTDGGTIAYLTSTTDDLALGGTTSSAPFFMDVSAGLNLNAPSSSSTPLTVKGATSQSVDLLQLKTSLDAVIAKVDQLGNITGNTLISTVATGTAPLTVSSTTVVSNLNVSQLQGYAASDLYSQPQPNLVLNSDFSRRNKWMTFMPEVFADTSGWTAITGSLGSVASSLWTPTPSAGNFEARAGLSTWRDIRVSGLFQAKGAAVNDTLVVGIWADANNWLRAQLDANLGRLYITENVGGASTNLTNTSDSGALTVNNYYWVELERQGTKIIVKWYSCGASAVAKSSCTLQNTASATTTLAATVSGYAYVRTFQAGTTHNIGGLSSGDGGVYVEGWGPESWYVTYKGTFGGQAIGFDESTDAGTLGKQWALRTYIPAASRGIELRQDDPTSTSQSSPLAPSTAYTSSTYEKVSGLGGSGALLWGYVRELTSGGSHNAWTSVLNDAGETSYTRKSVTFTTASGTAYMSYLLGVNYDKQTDAVKSATGTLFLDLPQVEKGSVATPWRNAPADDGPIVWEFTKNDGSDFTQTGNDWTVDTDPRNLAGNLFIPWDATLRLTVVGTWKTNTLQGGLFGSFTVGGTNIADPQKALFSSQTPTANYNTALVGTGTKRVSAGKNRVALRVNTDGGVIITVYGGSATAYDTKSTRMSVTATRGKFDLAEEYAVQDLSIQEGDVVRLASSGGTTVEKVDKGYDQSILGIVSTDPGITLSSTVELNGYREKDSLRPVALQGRVPVKVTSENGVIKRGDILTSSATLPGYAMKATKAGRSIGIAMEDFIVDSSEVQTRRIMTFVNLSFYDPDVYLADNGQFVVEKTEQQAQLAALGEDGLVQSSTEQQLQSSKYQLTNTVTKEVIERTGAYNDLFVANLKVGKLDASEITQLLKLEERIRNLELATSSAVLSSSISALLGSEPSASSSAIDNFTVLNKLLTTDLGVTGTITNGLLSIDGLNSSITAFNDLVFKLPGGELTIDKDGNLLVSGKITAQKVEADVFVSAKASGSWILPANTASTDVISENATETAKILITPTVLTDKVLTVTQKSVGKFTVSIKVVDTQDIKFDWFIIQ